MSSGPTVRQPAGVATGGQFAPTGHDEAEVDLDDEPEKSRPPLEPYRIVGLTYSTFKPHADAPARPGSSCWHCGTAISHVVTARHSETGETIKVGTTCAERIGLDPEGLRQMLRERYAAARDERSAARSAAWQAERDTEEAAETERSGPHGTDSRFDAGCRCDACLDVSPHGSWARFDMRDCHCDTCVAGVLATRPDFDLVETGIRLYDATTGAEIDADVVSTRFGQSWKISTGPEYDDVAWVSAHPARRATMAKKGYVEATPLRLIQEIWTRDGRLWRKSVAVIAEPTVDAWGAPMPTAG